MRQFKIGSAKALIWAALSFAVWWGGAPAFAETFYDFTFSSGAPNVTVTGVLGVTGSSGNYTVNSISGNVSGYSPQASGNGAIETILAPNSTNYLGIYNDNKLTYPNAPYLDPGGIGFQLQNGTDEQMTYSFSNSYYYLVDDNNLSSEGISSFTITPCLSNCPAPIPGAGLLSYLVLGVGGLFINRKRLLRAVQRTARHGV